MKWVRFAEYKFLLIMDDECLIISIKEARKILGKSYVGHSDDDVLRLIKQLDAIAKEHIQTVPKY